MDDSCSGGLHEWFTRSSSAGNRAGLERFYAEGMLSFIGSILSFARLGPTEATDYCYVCLRPVRAGEERVPVPGGGQVHRGCATYRMRQHTRTVHRIRSG